MSITYTWKITGLKKDTDGSVIQTYWEKIGTDAAGNQGVFNGATPFKADPESPTYIQFEDLTEEMVLSWIKEVVVDHYEEHVNQQIQKKIDELLISDAELPW